MKANQAFLSFYPNFIRFVLLQYMLFIPGINQYKIDKLSSPLYFQLKNTPWTKIFSSIPLWGLMISHFCHSWGFYTLLTCLPTYMSDVLHFDLSKVSYKYLLALPCLLQLLCYDVNSKSVSLHMFVCCLSCSSFLTTQAKMLVCSE